jgi:hypothetical protein
MDSGNEILVGAFWAGVNRAVTVAMEREITLRIPSTEASGAGEAQSQICREP